MRIGFTTSDTITFSFNIVIICTSCFAGITSSFLIYNNVKINIIMFNLDYIKTSINNIIERSSESPDLIPLESVLCLIEDIDKCIIDITNNSNKAIFNSKINTIKYDLESSINYINNIEDTYTLKELAKLYMMLATSIITYGIDD